MTRINLPMLLRVMGWLLMIEAAFMLVPLITSLVWHESDSVVFGLVAGLTLLSGVAMTFGIKPRRLAMGKHDGFLLTASVWVFFSSFGMLPFILGSTGLNISEAFFESMSGFTTTGASVISDISSLSHGMHIWRSLMQWIGGMGIILFTLAVLPMLNSSGGMQMFNAEVTGITHEKLRPRVSSTAQRLWLVYALLTLGLAILYTLGPMDTFDSVCHAFSTMSTGGFSTRAESITTWDSLYIKIVTLVFMFFGGVNFALIFKASTGRFREVWNNPIFRAYLSIVGIAFAVTVLALAFDPNTPKNWQAFTVDPLFHVISAISSTGYVSEGYSHYGYTVLAITAVLMFFGACAGSTSGGAKIDRAILMLRNSRNELHRCVYPNQILSITANHKVVSPEVVNKVMTFLALYTLVIVTGTLILSASNLAPFDSLMASMACVSNSGVPLATNQSNLFIEVPDWGKWVMSLLMLTGRLEIFTVLVLFTRDFWHK